MITLTTGVPGSGKSLLTIHRVKEKAEKEMRPVYYSGISDLKLPWIELDDPTQWDTLEAGSIIVIDECQRVFRPRGAGQQVPAYISAMETHRHKGYDIYLITQHPMLVDQNIRRLVGCHWHVVRKFGMQFAQVHEFGSTHEITSRNLANAIRTDFRYPKEAFNYYKSAELHTHKAKIPKRVWFLAAAPFLLVGLGWYGYNKALDVGKKPEALAAASPAVTSSVVPAAAPSGLPAQQTRAQYLAATQPRIDGLHATAPKYDELTRPTDAPWPAACMITKYFDQEKGKKVDKCGCIDQQGNRYGAGDSLCRDIALNGVFKDWGQQVQRVPASPDGLSQPAKRVDPAQGQSAAAPEADRSFRAG